MTALSRFLVASLASVIVVLAAGGAEAAHAAPLYHVTLAPAADAFAAGGEATVIVRVKSHDDAYPGLVFDAVGAEITGVVSLNPVSAGWAEGAVHLRRDMPGTATITATFAGQILAESGVRFVEMGAVGVSVTLNAGPDAAARTWLFEVTNTSGASVARLSIGTNGDAPTSTSFAQPLPYGFYTVRQVLGGDTGLSCVDGKFYRITSPVGGATTLELNASSAISAFVLELCPNAPTQVSVDIPIDTVITAPTGGVLGDALPGETPINEVRGVRQAGPAGSPFPPNTGSGAATADGSSNLLLRALGLALLAASLAWFTAGAVGRSRR